MGKELSLPYRQKIEKIQPELQKVINIFPGIFDSHEKAIGRYADFVRNPEIQVAVVGAVKAGKSTLMNSILGIDIASTEVTPETAALTVFKYSERDFFKVYFYNKNEWNELWDSVKKNTESLFFTDYKTLDADNIKSQWINHDPIEEFTDSIDSLKAKTKEYSSSKSAVHYFVKKLEIGLSKWGNESFPLSRDICFVDTPGLHDVIAYRANITKDYIDRANAVVVCVNSSTMRNEEHSTIVKTFENIGNDKNKVIVLGTQIDRLNKPVEDWEKQKEEWYKYLEPLYRRKESMQTNIIGVSSYVFRLLQKLEDGVSIDGNDINDITVFAEKNNIRIRPSDTNILAKLFSQEKSTILQKKEFILDCTNIFKFLRVLKEGPLNEPAKVLADDLHFRYEHVVDEVRKATENQKKQVEKQMELLNKDLKVKQSAIDKKNKELKNIKDSNKKIKDLFDKMQEEINSQLDKMKKDLNSELKKL